MTSRLPPVDVVVLGLGAANGVVAHVLTEAGLEVAALEAGPRVDRAASALDEVGNDLRARLSAPKALGEIPTWRTDRADKAQPAPYPTLMVNAVGGTTLHYEGLSGRFSPWNFETRTRVIERHGADAIPPDSTLADWSFSYDELEPYYDLTERAIGVSGIAANVAGSPQNAAGNIFEGKRSAPFPMPPLRSTGWSDLMSEAARRLDWHPFPAPAAINTEEYDGRSACTYCGFCQYNVCHCDAKGATHLNVIPRAEATGLLRVETDARVTRIDVNSDGLASGVTFVRDGQEWRQPAKIVAIGCFVFENVRLLLLSRSAPFPNGLANNSGQVGKHLIAHLCPFVQGQFPGKNLNLFNGNGSQVACVDDFNADRGGGAGDGFIGGGMIVAFREMGLIAHMKIPGPPSLPRWGAEWKAWMVANARSLGPTYGEFDALSYEDNFMDLDPEVTDAHGIPVIRVTHRVHENERRGTDFLRARQHEWLRAAGATETWDLPLHIEGRHCYGGTRMGSDPSTSVVDGYGFAHEIPNLAIVGASTFPTAGGINPTLTVQAAAWRTADWIIRNLRSESGVASPSATWRSSGPE
jgi:gluconate 2-dehydrogenase alpha chain